MTECVRIIPRAAFLAVLAMVSAAHAEPQHHWSRKFESTGLRVDAVAVDPQGSVVIVGYAPVSTDFGNGRVPGAGSDVFAAKFDTFGDVVWARFFPGNNSNQHARAVAIDSEGNVVIVGYYTANIDFGGGPMTANNLDVFVAKLGSDGAHRWSKHFSKVVQFSGGNYGEDVAVDDDDNVIVTGSFSWGINFGGGDLTNLGGQDAFLVKFDPDGNHVWSQRFGAPGAQYGKTVGVDASGGIVFAGSFQSSMPFGSGGVVSSGEDVFVARVEADGTNTWIRAFGDGSTPAFRSLAVDAAGAIVAAGQFSGQVDFGGNPLSTPGNDNDGYIVSLDAAGAHRWSMRIGGELEQSVDGIVLDAAGNVDATGSFAGSIDILGQSLSSAGSRDVFVACLDGNGAYRWASRFGDAGDDAAVGLGVDALGDMSLTGTFASSIDFGGGPLWGRSSNVYLARLGEGSIEPALAISLFPRAGAIEARWDITSRRPLERFLIMRDNRSRTDPRIVMAGDLQPQGTLVDSDVVAGETYSYQLIVKSTSGGEYRSSVVTASVPTFAPALAQNAPNPFNPTTSIAYTIAQRASVALEIFDATGARVRRIDQGTRDAGEYSVEWNGRDDAGRAVASGVYFYRLEGVGGVAPRKMVLLK